MEEGPRWKAKALAIEFWFVTAIVGGSFLAGLYGWVKTLLD